MQTFVHSVWPVRLLTFVMAALAAGSASFWALKWQDAPGPSETPVVLTPPQSIDTAKLAQLLGVSATGEAPTASGPGKYQLQGVIVQGTQGSQGSALIAIDSQPAKPYRVGQNVSDNLVLHSVARRSAALASTGQNKPFITLELMPRIGLKAAK